MLRRNVSSTVFLVFGVTWPRIKHRFPYEANVNVFKEIIACNHATVESFAVDKSSGYHKIFCKKYFKK